MANARSKDQTLLAFTLDRSLAQAMDDASRARGENRSQFIRRALVGYLASIGHPVAPEMAHSPDRRLMDRADPQPITAERKPVDYRKTARKTAPKKRAKKTP